MARIERECERAGDALEGVLVLHSLAGGTGSGLGCRLPVAGPNPQVWVGVGVWRCSLSQLHGYDGTAGGGKPPWTAAGMSGSGPHPLVPPRPAPPPTECIREAHPDVPICNVVVAAFQSGVFAVWANLGCLNEV